MARMEAATGKARRFACSKFSPALADPTYAPPDPRSPRPIYQVIL